MKTSSKRAKGNAASADKKEEGRRALVVFPFLLGLLTFFIDGLLSFYSFWNSGIGLTSGWAIGLTFGSLGFALFVIVVTYFAIKNRY